MTIKRQRRNRELHDPALFIKDHLQELRNSLLQYVATLVFFTAIAFYFREEISTFLIKPLGTSLYYTSPTGAFSFVFQLSLVTGLAASFPVLLYQILKFIQPSLPRKIHFLRMTIFSALLMSIGVLLAYVVLLPASLHVLSLFQSSTLQSFITSDSYFRFIVWYLIGFGLVFQIPLVIFTIHTVYPFDRKIILKNTRYIVIAILIISAIVTPTTDILNQLIVTGILMVLFIITLLVLK